LIFSIMPVGIVAILLFPDLQEGGIQVVTIFNIAAIFVGYLIAILIKRFKNIRKRTVLPRVARLAPLSVVFVVAAFLAAIIAPTFGLDIVLEAGMVIMVALLAWLIFSNFFLLDMLSAKYEEKLASERQTREKEYYFAQCQLMQESVNKMKAYRHDVKLHLTALKKFTADNKEATDYLNNLLGSVEESEVYSDTGNIAFDSIINFKLKDVLTNHINLQLKIFVPPELDVDVSDVVTILGNLLDNAFEAMAKTNDKQLKLTVEVNRGVLFIRMDNTYDGVVKYVNDKDDAQKIIATRKDGDNHGYGLKNIQKSVDKYNGQMDISHDDNIFSVAILLYV